jgi:hypothetical protein
MDRINESTSVIAIKTRPLTSGQTAIVYLSSTSDIGQLATVCDIQGFLSSPQSILISTTPGVSLTNFTSSLRMQQKFGYITLRSNTSNRWSVVDENAFRDPSQTYVTSGIQFSSIQTSNLSISSRTHVSTTTSQVFSAQSFETIGSLFISSIGSSTSTFLMNSFSNTSNWLIQSSISFRQAVTTLSSVSTNGTIYVQNSLTVGESFTALSSIFMQSSLTSAQRILVNSNLTVQGIVTGGSNMQAFTSIITSTLVSPLISARNYTTDIILFSTTQLYMTSNNSLFVSTSLSVSNIIQTSTLYLSNISTQALTITSTLFAPSLHLPNASIQNANGSFTTSSLEALSIQYSSLYGSNATSTVNFISTQSSYFSTLYTNDGVYTQATIIPNAYFSSIYSNNMLANVFVIGGSGGILLDTINISTMVVSSAFVAGNASSFVASADIYAYNILTRNTTISSMVTSYLSNVISITATSNLTIYTPRLYASSINATYMTVSTCTTSTMHTLNGSIGLQIQTDPAAPYFVPSTFSGLTSNTPSEYIRGSGLPYDPLHVLTTRDFSIGAYISNCTVSTAYLTLKYSYRTNAPSTTGSASIILKNPIQQSTIIQVSPSPGYQILSLSNYPIDPRVISTVYTYNLVGPMTYALPSSSQSQETLLSGGEEFKLAYSSDGGNYWTTLPLVGFESGCKGIAAGNTKWLAVGEGTTNTIIFSYTGTIWYNLGKTVFSVKGLGVIWNGLLWVALGEGTNTVATSLDGINWTGFGTSIFSTRGYSAAAEGSTLWIAVGEGTNTLARSTDGAQTWTGLGSTVFSVAAYGIAWNGALWIAVGEGTNTLATSTDGITWTGFGTSVFQTDGRAIAWNGSYWLAGSKNNPSNRVAYSTNGASWTPVICPLTSVYSILWTGTQWVASGTSPTSSFATSPDGLVWTLSTSTIYTSAYTVASRGSSLLTPPLYIATGSGGNQLATSTDGSTWTSRAIPFTTSTNCVAWNGAQWVAGGSGSYVLAYSSNGITWTGVSLTNMTVVNAVAWGKGKWIAVGTGGGGYTRAESSNGIAWTELAYTVGGFFSTIGRGIIWAQGLWMATGAPEGSGLLYTLDGTNWIPQTAPLFSSGHCVSSNGTLFVAGGAGTSRLVYSLEGAIWASVDPCPFTTQVNGIAWGGRVWVAAGSGTHTLAYSYDGMQWVGLGTSVFSTAGTSVVWTGSGWIATGSGTNTIATSLDGITWNGQGSSVFSVEGTSVTSQIIQPNTIVEREEPVKIRWDLSGVALLSPSVIEKPVRTNPGYDSVARSLDAYTESAYLQFRPKFTTGSVRIGITESVTGNISYAISLLEGDLYKILEFGVQVASPGSFQNSDLFEIVFTGTRVSYRRNSVEVYSSPRGIGQPLYTSAQFNLGGTQLYDLDFHPVNTITATTPSDSQEYYTSVLPSALITQPLTYKRLITETEFTPSLWQFGIPISGTLINPLVQLYADVYIDSTRLFSTSLLQTTVSPTISTNVLSYTLLTSVATTPGDTLEVRLYTQRSRGVVSLQNTYLSTIVYNLSSTQYVEINHNSGGIGGQTGELSLWIQNVSTPIGNYLNNADGVLMNRGFLRWNHRQYGLTIQNQYNDMQTRSITYTGGLYIASDSNLKYNTEYADVSSIHDAIAAVPLHRYTLIRPYRNAFCVEDTRQLGVITNEVSRYFPSMIHTADSEIIPSLQMVDRVQFRHAHIGATQHIMRRLSTLRSNIEAYSRKNLHSGALDAPRPLK